MITNLCAVVPGGIVCFFPSYDYENMVCTKWENIGVMDKIRKKKQVFNSQYINVLWCVCMCVCACVRACVCVDACVHACCVYAHMCVFEWIRVCLHVCVNTLAYITGRYFESHVPLELWMMY